MLDRFVRVTRQHPCPVCGKPDWCIVSREGDTAICPRTIEGAVRYITDTGYLHRLDGAALPGRGQSPPHPTARPALPAPSFDAEAFARQCHDAVREDDLDMMGIELGVSPYSLERLRTGWSQEHMAYTFPMRNDHNEIIGVRLRNIHGRKWAVAGSRAGLFIPAALTGKDPLLICEGPTDTAALLTLGFDALGRPSCTGGTDYLIAGLRRRRRAVVVVADRDGPGWQGAQQLAQQIARVTSSLKVLTPVGAKDAREWVRSGVTAAVVREIIASAAQWRPAREVNTW